MEVEDGGGWIGPAFCDPTSVFEGKAAWNTAVDDPPMPPGRPRSRFS